MFSLVLSIHHGSPTSCTTKLGLPGIAGDRDTCRATGEAAAIGSGHFHGRAVHGGCVLFQNRAIGTGCGATRVRVGEKKQDDSEIFREFLVLGQRDE